MKIIEVEGYTFIQEKINCIGPLIGKDGNSFYYFFNVLCDGGNISVGFELPDPLEEMYKPERYKPAQVQRWKDAQQRYQMLKDQLLGYLE